MWDQKDMMKQKSEFDSSSEILGLARIPSLVLVKN
jgi:hypothetical protein